jgi:hypothetical protein
MAALCNVVIMLVIQDDFVLGFMNNLSHISDPSAAFGSA